VQGKQAQLGRLQARWKPLVRRALAALSTKATERQEAVEAQALLARLRDSM